MLLTCVCVWWRWTACHPSSCRWSCRSAGPGIPPPSSETTAAASLWPSCRPTDRSPEYLRSVGQDGQTVSHTNYRDLLSYPLDLLCSQLVCGFSRQLSPIQFLHKGGISYYTTIFFLFLFPLKKSAEMQHYIIEILKGDIYYEVFLADDIYSNVSA